LSTNNEECLPFFTRMRMWGNICW